MPKNQWCFWMNIVNWLTVSYGVVRRLFGIWQLSNKLVVLSSRNHIVRTWNFNCTNFYVISVFSMNFFCKMLGYKVFVMDTFHTVGNVNVIHRLVSQAHMLKVLSDCWWAIHIRYRLHVVCIEWTASVTAMHRCRAKLPRDKAAAQIIRVCFVWVATHCYDTC